MLADASVRVSAVFLEAGEAFCDVARDVKPARLDDQGTGAWTVRELIGHATRGVLTVETALTAPLDQTSARLSDATDYFATAMSMPGIHAGIEQRARDAAAAVGDDPGRYARGALERVAPLVSGADEDRDVQPAAGRITLREYLRTRIVELTLHTVDVQLAVGLPARFPAAPAAVTRDVLLGLAGCADALAFACAISGRGTALSCNVLG